MRSPRGMVEKTMRCFFSDYILERVYDKLFLGRGGGVRHDIFFLGSGMENRGCALAQGSFYEGFSPMSKKPCAILSKVSPGASGVLTTFLGFPL